MYIEREITLFVLGPHRLVPGAALLLIGAAGAVAPGGVAPLLGAMGNLAKMKMVPFELMDVL